jgi:hypothetical protein
MTTQTRTDEEGKALTVARSCSPYTPDDPPPVCPPVGTAVAIGWELAARLWRLHVPDPLMGGDICTACSFRLPCPSWSFADAFLADTLPMRPTTRPGHPPPGVRDAAIQTSTPLRYHRLPRQEPDTAPTDIEERHSRWFTPKTDPSR